MARKTSHAWSCGVVPNFSRIGKREVWSCQKFVTFTVSCPESGDIVYRSQWYMTHVHCRVPKWWNAPSRLLPRLFRFLSLYFHPSCLYPSLPSFPTVFFPFPFLPHSPFPFLASLLNSHRPFPFTFPYSPLLPFHILPPPFFLFHPPPPSLRISLLPFPDLLFPSARQSSSGRQPNCGVQQRTPPIFSRAVITLGIGPRSSILLMIFAVFDPSPLTVSMNCSFWAIVCKAVRPMLSDRCPVCLSVCLSCPVCL